MLKRFRARKKTHPSTSFLSPGVPDWSPHKQTRAKTRTVYIAQARLWYLSAVFAALFLAIGLRVIDLSLLQESTDNDSRLVQADQAASYGRANIVDRQGTILASSLSTASLYANPKELLDIDEAARKLSAVLPELSEKTLRQRLDRDKSFVWIKRNLSPEQQYRVHMLGLPGLSFQREERRVYPLGNLFSHVLGFTDVDNQGIAGIEKSFDGSLRKSAEPLRLSVDVRLQSILRQELLQAVNDFNARGAGGIILDAKTGEILALASLPDFDPHQPGRIDVDAKFNRVTLGVYEMGSTFKIFNTAMALDSGKVGYNQSFDATAPIRVGRFTIEDFHPENRWLTVPEIFEHSSNIGSAKMALMAGVANQKSFLQRLGLLDPPHLELPELGQPMVPRRWDTTTAMTVSYGYGISVTPLQLTRAVAAVVNGGTLPELTLLARDRAKPASNPRVLSADISHKMRDLLRLVVQKGTGQKADVRGYFVGGKTGTAEKHAVGGYAEKKLISSFVGVFPVQNPKYVILAMIDEPKANKTSFGFATGGWVAAPTVQRVIARMAPLLGLPPIDHPGMPLASKSIPREVAYAPQ
jgi:cell division protein FtsI (penicillin-binding protein 3)